MQRCNFRSFWYLYKSHFKTTEMTRKQYVDSLLYEFYNTKTYDPTVLIMHPKTYVEFVHELKCSSESYYAIIGYIGKSHYKGLTIFRSLDAEENAFIIK